VSSGGGKWGMMGLCVGDMGVFNEMGHVLGNVWECMG